jgi:hypothetical protein
MNVPSPRHGTLIFTFLLLACSPVFLVLACSPLAKAKPSAQLEAVGFSSERKYELAMPEAQNRALLTAAKLVRARAMSFEYMRERGVSRLRLVTPPALVSESAKVAPRKPFGAAARVVLKRAEEDMAVLSTLQVTQLSTEVQGLGIAEALKRAERDLYKQAIERFAKANGRDEEQLRGVLSLVEQELVDLNDRVTLRVIVAVEFDLAGASALAPAVEVSTFDVDREEIEPLSEQSLESEVRERPRSQPASQPASLPSSVPATKRASPKAASDASKKTSKP